jgi:hypothetical protein
MRMLTRLSVVMGGLVTLALTAGATGPAAADESTIYEGQTVSREFTQYEDTPNGRVATNITVTESVRADTAPQPAARSCWIHEYLIVTKSLWATQHKWQHEVYWCFDGNRTALVRYNHGVDLGTGSFWHFMGNVAGYDRIINQVTYFDVRKQGRYCLHYPKLYCVQENKPAHRGKYLKGAVTTVSWQPR